MVTRSILMLGAVLMLFGCAQDNTEDAKKAVKQHLPVSYKVEYSELQNFPGGIVCGQFNPIGRHDVPEGLRPFIYRGGEADKAPSADDLDIFCSKDPAAKFQARFGIGPPGQDNSTVMAVQKDLTDLNLALEVYLADNRIYPITHQGLDALVKATEAHPKPISFREGGYISAVPKDPWGRPYHYSSEEKLRTEPIDYSLYTLGKDGEEGGTGENADISNLHLKYLNHLANL